MKARNKRLASLSLVVGAMAFSTLPVWAQSSYPSERQGSGSSASQGQAGSSEGVKQGAPLRDDRTQTGAMGQGQSGSEQGAPRSGSMAGNKDIKKVQQALKEKGQDPGAIDGVMGPKTKEALKAFQQQQGLKATGTLDDQTKQALGIEQGSSAQSGQSGRAAGGSSSEKSARGAEGGKEQ